MSRVFVLSLLVSMACSGGSEDDTSTPVSSVPVVRS